MEARRWAAILARIARAAQGDTTMRVREAGSRWPRVFWKTNGAARFKFKPRADSRPQHPACCAMCRSLSGRRAGRRAARRPDGSYIFHFVNVVDDIEMGITHVIRGEDHLSNTWKHIDLFHALRQTRTALRAHPAHLEPRRLEDEQA